MEMEVQLYAQGSKGSHIRWGISYVQKVTTILFLSQKTEHRQNWFCFFHQLKPLNTSGNYMYRQWSLYVTFSNSTFCPRSVFVCFVWIWEQTAIISLYSINWLVGFYNRRSVYCAVRSKFYLLPTQCIYVFCVDLRTNSDYFTVQH